MLPIPPIPLVKRSLAEIIAEKRAKELAAKEAAEGNSQVTTSTLSESEPKSEPIIPIASQKPQPNTAQSLLARIKALQNKAKDLEASPIQDAIPSYLNDLEKHGIRLTEVALKALSPDHLATYLAKLAEIEAEDSAILELSASKETFSLSISLNTKQLLAKDLAFNGKSFCLIGAAGTGKTTAQREIAASLLDQNQLGTHTFRIQGTSPAEYCSCPSIGFVAYTRIASGNLRRAIHKNPSLEEALRHNVTTIHNLLEYQPEFYYDYDSNEEKFHFIPKRTAANPLDLTHLIIEEASMVGLDLWEKLFSALRPNTQIIFIGDINQLPPVFGPSILNYALVQLPTVELTTVYRQAGDSSILENAHRILAGNSQLLFDSGTKIITGGDKQFSQTKLAQSIGMLVPKWRALGEYNPDTDIFLSPWNKRELGTDHLNKIIAQHIGDERQAIVYEIICGITKVYLAVGDKVLFNKQVGYVKSIHRNGQYVGKNPKQESCDLTRFGTYRASIEETEEDFELAGYENISLEEILEQEQGEKKRQSSHVVELDMETGFTETLSAVGDFAPASFSLGYALTVHKAQGCEWRKVFFILHRDHAISAYRELLYTAATRAREQLVLIAKDSMIEKAVKTQRIKGNTLAEKIEYFNSGLLNQEDVSCTK